MKNFTLVLKDESDMLINQWALLSEPKDYNVFAKNNPRYFLNKKGLMEDHNGCSIGQDIRNAINEAQK